MPVWIPAFFMRCRSVLLLILFHLQSHKREPSGCIDTVIRGKAEPEKHLLSENQRGAQKQRPQKTSAKPDLVADGATVPRAVVVCLSQDEKGEEKQGKKQSNAQKTLPKALFFVILRCSFPLFCSLPSAPEDPSTPELWHSKIFLSRDAPFANENKMETKCKKAFGKGRSKRERAGIKSGERHFKRKIQTAFCPRRRLFPRPPFC